MNNDVLGLVFFYSTLQELSICSQVCKQWKCSILWISRQPFPFVKNIEEFKKWYQIPMIGAVIELSGSEIINDASSIDKTIDYNLQRHWTCAPIGKRKPGVYISLDCNNLDVLQRCFPEFKIKQSKRPHHYELFALLTQKKIDKQDDPIFDTLECATTGTIDRNERNVYGYPFKRAWNSLNIQKHGYVRETKVQVDWKKYHYVSGIHSWHASQFHSFIIEYFLNRFYLLDSAEDIQIKSMTKVSNHSFLRLTFKDLLDYNQYVEIYKTKSRSRAKKM
jgi:hypothetical protein